MTNVFTIFGGIYMRRFGAMMILALMFFVASTANAAKFRPTPDNKDLKKAFDSIKVPAGDISTTIRLITRNERAWYTRWKMISDAKKTIDCTYYIVDKDIFGQSFIGLLLHKAKQGVKIRLMIDGRVYRMPYMKSMPDKIQELASLPNVQVKIYNAVSKSFLSAFKDLKNIVASDHDKIIVVDGITSIVGGRNIGADYYADKGENDIVYRETDVVMRGRHVAEQLDKAFEDEWKCLTNCKIKADKINFNNQMAIVDLAYKVMDRYLHGRGIFNPDKARMSRKIYKALVEMNKEITKFKKITGYTGFKIYQGQRKEPVKILDKYSYLGALNGITPNLVKFIDASKREIIIQNPYLVITKTAEKALTRASKRGVKIIFHTNSANSTDSLFPQAFLMNDWKRILKEMPTARMLVAPSENERIHSKTFVFDSLVTVVGTYNMDPLSEQVNSEVVAAIYSKEFGKRAQLRIYNDLKKVVEYKIKLDSKGNIIKAYGPKDHVSKKIIRKMNILRKLQWLRPVI